MFTSKILLLGVALAIDAAVVAFALSLIHKKMDKFGRVKSGSLIALVFGLFQFLMLWLGSYFGFLLTFSSYGYLFQFSSGLIFMGLGLKCLFESLSSEKKPVVWSAVPFLILAFVTSIDAFASGISLGTLPKVWLAAVEVGIVTFFICGLSYTLGNFFLELPDKWLLRFASVIFFFLSAQILWSFRFIIFRG